MSARTRGHVNGVPPGDPRPEMTAERTELLGLGVLVTVMDRLTLAERRRALTYLADRFGPVVVPANVHVIPDVAALIGMLTAQRRASGMTQQAVAAQIGTTQSAVSEWETGTSGITAQSLFSIAEVLGCDIALVPRGDR